MTEHSPELPPRDAPASSDARATARILPFERPQSDLQRAIQARAQETIERERARDREVRRPQPLKWLIVSTIALVPVVLIFGAVDGFLRALHRFNETYQSAPPAQAAGEPAGAEDSRSTQPGVVILQRYDTQAGAASTAPAAGAASPRTQE